MPTRLTHPGPNNNHVYWDVCIEVMELDDCLCVVCFLVCVRMFQYVFVCAVCLIINVFISFAVVLLTGHWFLIVVHKLMLYDESYNTPHFHQGGNSWDQ